MEGRNETGSYLCCLVAAPDDDYDDAGNRTIGLRPIELLYLLIIHTFQVHRQYCRRLEAVIPVVKRTRQDHPRLRRISNSNQLWQTDNRLPTAGHVIVKWVYACVCVSLYVCVIMIASISSLTWTEHTRKDNKSVPSVWWDKTKRWAVLITTLPLFLPSFFYTPTHIHTRLPHLAKLN